MSVQIYEKAILKSNYSFGSLLNNVYNGWIIKKRNGLLNQSILIIYFKDIIRNFNFQFCYYFVLKFFKIYGPLLANNLSDSVLINYRVFNKTNNINNFEYIYCELKILNYNNYILKSSAVKEFQLVSFQLVAYLYLLYCSEA